MPLSKSIEILRRSSLASQDSASVLAALLLLRHVDFQDSEAEAVALFEDREYHPRLPRELQWRIWVADLDHDWLSKVGAAQKNRLHVNNGLGAALTTAIDILTQCKLGIKTARELLQGLEAIPFETPAQQSSVGIALQDLAGQVNSQELYTPQALAKLMAGLAQVKPQQQILDPFFRNGELLSAAQEFEPAVLAGYEMRPRAFLLGYVVLALTQSAKLQLAQGNSLEQATESTYDVALCNPPWGMPLQDSLVSHLLFPVKKSELAYLQLSLQAVRSTGRVVCCLPMGFFVGRGPEQKIREWLLRNHSVEWVITLPAKTFAPFTMVKTALVVIRKGVSTESVRFADCSEVKDISTLATSLWENRFEGITSVSVAKLLEQNSELVVRTAADDSVKLNQFAQSEQVTVLPLGEIAKIALGPVIPVNVLADVPEIENPVPYFRIGDVDQGRLGRPNSWLNKKALDMAASKIRLRAGNVLVSGSGTLGKVAVVSNGAVGGVASSSFYVLQIIRDDVDPNYLAAYLASAEVRAIWQSRNRSTTIPRISATDLRDLQIPLITLPLQTQALAHSKSQQVSIIESLEHLLLGEGRDPILAWIRRTLSRLGSTEFSECVEGLQQASQEIQSITLQEPQWFLQCREILALATEIQRIPKGVGLLSILSMVREKWITLRNQVAHSTVGFSELFVLLESMNAMLARLCEELDSWIELKVEILESPHGISLKVYNQAPMPLRNLQFSMRFPSQVVTRIYAYIADGADVQIDLSEWESDIAPLSGQILPVEWSVQGMQGASLKGMEALALPRWKTNEIKPWSDAESSPYVTGDPIRPDRLDVFVGREVLLDEIRNQIQHSGNVILLEGNRRAGKTSILKQLEGSSFIPGWLCVYYSLQGVAGSEQGTGVPTCEVFRSIATAIASALHLQGIPCVLPDGKELPMGGKPLGIARACRSGISEEAPFEDFKEYFQIALESTIQKGLGMVLMMDEFDKLQEGIDNKVTSPQVPENIRYLVQNNSHFSAILTGSRRMKRLREEYWSVLFGLGRRIGVTALSPESADRLIIEPVKTMLRYSQDAVQKLSDLSARQPYILQCLCNQVFCYARQHEIRLVQSLHVDVAAQEWCHDNEHFRSLWGYAGSNRRHLILGICRQPLSNDSSLSFTSIQEELIQRGVEVSAQQLTEDLDSLRELELLEFENQKYRLGIPLMGLWMDLEQDMKQVLENAKNETEVEGE